MRRLWIPFALVAAAAGAFFIFQFRPSTARANDAAPVAVALEREFRPRITATGAIRLATGAQVNVGARASGVLRRLHVRQGAFVRKGDLIAELDDREAVLQLKNTEATLLERQAALAKARSDRDRLRPLMESRHATRSDWDNLESLLQQADARVSAAQIAVDLARVQLDYMTIRAPISGIVASVSTQEGETIAASFSAPTFVTIIDPTQLECVALVDETDIGRVSVGDSTEFTVDGYPGRIFTGTVARIAPDASVVNGVVNYETIIVVRDASGALRPQMTANVTIQGPATRTLVVPTSAVRQGSDGAYVWRKQGKSPARAPLRIGARQPDFTQIVGGLAAGDTVLTGAFPDGQTE